jgi:hypothetical protein
MTDIFSIFCNTCQRVTHWSGGFCGNCGMTAGCQAPADKSLLGMGGARCGKNPVVKKVFGRWFCEECLLLFEKDYNNTLAGRIRPRRRTEEGP